MSKPKYEVVDFTTSGFFIHGGSLTENYIKDRDEADMICEALNTTERWRRGKVLRLINDAISSLEELGSELRQDE